MIGPWDDHEPGGRIGGRHSKRVPITLNDEEQR